MDIRFSLIGENPHAIAQLPSAGVGLLRGEFLFRARGEHPMIATAREALQRYVDDVCGAFAPHAVWYRVADFWSDEANILKGCDITVEEPNPLVGLRGIRRGFAEPDALDLELKALAQVAATRSNLHVLFPFVQDADELDRCTQFLDRARWPNRFGSMLEIPSALIDVPRMVAVGATNFLVGFNDLSSLLLGRERGGEEIQRHRAMWWAVDYVARHVPAQLEWGIAGRLSKQTIEAARERNVPYASIRYMDLPALLGLDPQQLPDLTLETTIKTRTREQILARRASLKNEPQSS